MAESILLLEVRGGPRPRHRLGELLGRLIEGPREVAVPLADWTPEEVLSACSIVGLEVLRSRVVISRTEAALQQWRVESHE